MVKLRSILIIIILEFTILNLNVAFSQSLKDSLRFSLNIAGTDFQRADIYFQLAQIEFNEKNYIVSLNDANKALEYSNLSDNKLVKANSYFLIAKIDCINNDIENAITFYTRANNLYESIKNIKKQIQVYSEVADLYTNLRAYSKAAENYKKAYELSESIDDNQNETIFLENTADSYFIHGDFENAEKYYLILKDLNFDKNNRYDKIKLLYKLSETYKNQGIYDKSQESNLYIYNIYSEINDTSSMAIISNNIAYTYLNLNEYQQALVWFKNSLQYALKSKIDHTELATLYSNMAICYQNLKDIDNALINLKLALKELDETDNYYEIARLENITAKIYHNIEDLHNADYFSQNSIENAQKSGDKNLLQACYYTYSQILRDGNDYVTALEYYEKHLRLKDSVLFDQRMKEQELNQRILNLEKTEKELKLKLADEEVKDFALRQMHLEAEKREKEMELLKSEKNLEQSEKDRLQQSLQIAKQRHEAEMRERELQQLEQEKAIQDLVIKQKESEEKERQKEIELQKMKIEQQEEARKRGQIVFALLSVIGILILIGLVVTFKKNKTLAKQKLEIEYKNQDLEQKNEEILTQSERIVQQKELIEKKNEEITDSIHYAKRIQNAMLPSIDVLEKYLTEFFILFKPKDIVSGDFYWAAEKNDKLIVTAVDCTGHGVPGAFMSMLGMSFLNEIVLKEETVEADKILNQLRFEVIKSLKQSGKDDEAKDGMDMSLCVIDKKQMKLQFAGANNPLYFIRNGELEKVKPDRMPIGIHFRSDADFTLQELDLKKGDTLYIFTDGFADQFGGDDGRKLKYKPFQDLIFDIHKTAMSEQKDKLDQFFANWRGDYEQIDDVLVIGIRV